MPFKAGQSGNPNGRPPKGRALAEQILKALEKTYADADGKRHSGKILLGNILASAVLTGEAVLISGKKTVLPPREWIELVKFVSVHVDGSAKTEVDVTSGGESLSTELMRPSDIAASVAAILATVKDASPNGPTPSDPT